MRATRLCSYRTIAIKQKRHTFSCKALLQPYAGSPAASPNPSAHGQFLETESTITAAAAATSCYAANTARYHRCEPPHPLSAPSRKVTCWSYAVAWLLLCWPHSQVWLAVWRFAYPFGAGAEKTCNRVELQKKKPRERQRRLLPGRGSCGEMVWGM